MWRIRSGAPWTGAVVVFLVIAVTGCASAPPQPSVPEPAGPFIRQPSWEGDCRRRPPGTVCAVFPDGYVWLIRDAVMGWSEPVGEWEGRPIEAVVGRTAVYYHVRGTYMVYVGPLEKPTARRSPREVAVRCLLQDGPTPDPEEEST